jgi:hypothetical protein
MAFFGLYRLLSEFSTIFVNIRWLLLTYNMKNSALYLINGGALIILFFTVRIIAIPPFWYFMYKASQSPHWPHLATYHKIICVGVSIPLDLLNVYWFYKVILIAVKVVKPLLFPQKQSSTKKEKKTD